MGLFSLISIGFSCGLYMILLLIQQWIRIQFQLLDIQIEDLQHYLQTIETTLN